MQLNDHIINDLVQLPINWRRLCKGSGQVERSVRDICTLESPPAIPDLAQITWQNCSFRLVFCLCALGLFGYILICVKDFRSENIVATRDSLFPASKNAISPPCPCRICLASCPTDSTTKDHLFLGPQ